MTRYDDLAGAFVFIVSDKGRPAMLRINDCGYDYNAGLFKRSKVSDYFLPVSSPVGFGRGYPVAIDVPRQAFTRIFENTRTRLVYGWVVRCERGDVGEQSRPGERRERNGGESMRHLQVSHGYASGDGAVCGCHVRCATKPVETQPGPG